MADIESSLKDLVEISIDDNVLGKEVVLCFSDSQIYTRKEACLAIFRVEEVQNRLRAAFQKHNGDLVKYLLAKKCQYETGLMTVARRLSAMHGAANVIDTLEHCGKERVVKNKFWFAVFDGRDIL